MAQAPTRQRLIDTAGELFYEKGFQAVGLSEIIDKVGITKTAFYKHFDSKDDLIIAILDNRDARELEEWTSYVRIRGRDSARAQILAFFDLLDEWFRQPDFRGCLFLNALTEFPASNDPINRAARAHGEHLAGAILQLARAAGASDPVSLTSQIMLLITGAIASRHRAGDMHAAETASRVARVLVDNACDSDSRIGVG